MLGCERERVHVRVHTGSVPRGSTLYMYSLIHCKKWVVILTIRYGYLSCNIAICNYELSRGIGYPQGMMSVYLKRYRISTRNDVCISQDTPCNITLSHRGSHVYNPTVLYFCIKV